METRADTGPENQRRWIETLLKTVRPNARPLFWEPLDGGLSAQMVLLHYEEPDGEVDRLVLRRQGDASFRREPDRLASEHELLQSLAELPIPAPHPICFYTPPRGRTELERPVLVLPYLAGEPLFDADAGKLYAREASSLLARIHRVTVPSHFANLLPNRSERVSRLLSRTPERLDEELLEGRIRKCLQSRWPPADVNGVRLLHGDFWPGNLLWRDRELVGVIDWEDAAMGDPLSDLAICRLDTAMIFGDEAARYFEDHYRGQSDLDLAPLPLWDLWAALRPAGQLHLWAESWTEKGRPDITYQSMRDAHRRFVDRALDRLDTSPI